MIDIHPITLEGRVVRLEPLALHHVPGLLAHAQDESIWRYLPSGSLHTEPLLLAHMQLLWQQQAQGKTLPFAVIYRATEQAIGMTRFMDIRPEHRGVEIGGSWYGAAYQRTAVNTEAKFLLLQHAFDVWGCLRVQLKADARNTRSLRAIQRLGAVYEGVLRQHFIMPDGYVRDSVMYSILDKEWPAVKARLQELIGSGCNLQVLSCS